MSSLVASKVFVDVLLYVLLIVLLGMPSRASLDILFCAPLDVLLSAPFDALLSAPFDALLSASLDTLLIPSLEVDLAGAFCSADSRGLGCDPSSLLLTISVGVPWSFAAEPRLIAGFLASLDAACSVLAMLSVLVMLEGFREDCVDDFAD